MTTTTGCCCCISHSSFSDCIFLARLFATVHCSPTLSHATYLAPHSHRLVSPPTSIAATTALLYSLSLVRCIHSEDRIQLKYTLARRCCCSMVTVHAHGAIVCLAVAVLFLLSLDVLLVRVNAEVVTGSGQHIITDGSNGNGNGPVDGDRILGTTSGSSVGGGGDIDNIFSIFRSGAKRKRGAKRKKCERRCRKTCRQTSRPMASYVWMVARYARKGG